MIDTNVFEPTDSRWKDIYLHLSKEGLDVFPPGIKGGECISEYIVVKNDGSSRYTGISTDEDLYSVMCYVPKQMYSTLEPLVQRVKKIMKDLEPMIVPYGSQTPSFYDDKVKAHMISIEYKNYKKML